jgi:DNA-binding beta-propeller fold protein YncE
MRAMRLLLAVLLALAVATPAGAEIRPAPGFTAATYVSGTGFGGASAGLAGIPSISTLVVDGAGTLYLARTGRRYTGGEAEDSIWPVYRVPPGGARLTPETEARHLYGPPLPNPQVGAVRAGGDLLVTTFDRDRHVGVLYRVVDGRATLLAGGTPPPGTPPLLRQPEGVAVDGAGNVYVADRAQDAVVRLDAAGRVLDPRWVTVKRPRVLAVDARGRVWIGADGDAEAPWAAGTGEIWLAADGVPRLVLRGPRPAAIAAVGDALLVADRQGRTLFVLAADGRRAELAHFTDADAPRGLALAPSTPDTVRAGIAGDLFVATIPRGVFSVSEIIRLRGPFADLLRDAR